MVMQTEISGTYLLRMTVQYYYSQANDSAVLYQKAADIPIIRLVIRFRVLILY